MPDFTVDIGGLSALSTNLDSTVDNIESALDEMKDIQPKSIGPDSLDKACAEFNSDWQGGLTKISDAVGQVKGGVDKAVKGYDELESNLEETLAKMAKGVESAGGQEG